MNFFRGLMISIIFSVIFWGAIFLIIIGFSSGCAFQKYQVYHLGDLKIAIVEDQEFLNTVCYASEGYECYGCYQRMYNTIYTKPDFDVLMHELLHWAGHEHRGAKDFDYRRLKMLGVIEERRY